MPISEIVHVSISAQDAAPSQASFDKIMVAGYHTVGTELIRDYTDATAFQTDFAAFPGILSMGNAFFAQSPHPVTLSVGRLTTARAKIFTITPVVANLQAYTIYINGTAYTYTSDGTATASEIVVGLQAAITALPVTGVTPTNDGTTLTLTSTAGVWYSLGVDRPNILTVTETTAATGLATELTNITAERDDFYGMALEHQSEAYIDAAAAWVLTQRKLYGASSPNADIATGVTTDVASDVKLAGNNRTFVRWASKASAQYPEVAMMSALFVKNPGGATWNYKAVAGVSAQPASGTDITNLKAKNSGIVRLLGGLTLTFGSKLASGRYIDVQHGMDWLTARLEERMYFLLARNDKVPYTDAGLVAIEGEVRAQLQEGIRNQFLADDGKVDVFITPVAQQNPVDRASRIVRGIQFRARLAGAVEEMYITGTIFP